MTSSSHPTFAEAVCPSCGQTLLGKFCSACGEKKREHHDYTVAHFLELCLEVVAHADSRAATSFRRLLLQPGFLTTEFMAGRRKPYLSPVQTFIIANLFFFFLSIFSHHLTGTVGNLHLYTTRPPDHGGDWSDKLVRRAAARRQVQIDEYVDLFNEKAESKAESMVMLMVPVFALGLALVQWQRPFVEHLVFSFHLFGFYLAMVTVTTLLGDLSFFVRHVLLRLSAESWIGYFWWVGWWILTFVYLYLAMRRVYPQPLTKLVPKFLFLVIWFVASYLLYYVLLIALVLFTA